MTAGYKADRDAVVRMEAFPASDAPAPAVEEMPHGVFERRACVEGVLVLEQRAG